MTIIKTTTKYYGDHAVSFTEEIECWELPTDRVRMDADCVTMISFRGK